MQSSFAGAAFNVPGDFSIAAQGLGIPGRTKCDAATMKSAKSTRLVRSLARARSPMWRLLT